MANRDANQKALGRNDPCWCGSGEKYKKCHLDREFEKPLPLRAAERILRDSWKHKSCLHPSAGAGICDQIVSAHSVQRGRTLERIVDRTQHVHTFTPLTADENGGPLLQRIGWRKASTFTGFCAKHDALTFEPLEKNEFVGSPEQCFLIGYRGLCHEVFQKVSALQANKALRDILDKGMSVESQKQLQGEWDVIEAGTRAGLADFVGLKGLMDEQLLARDYSNWSHAIVSFRGDLCLASTGTLSPNVDLDGRRLQVLHDVGAHQESLPFGLVATSDGGAVVFIWRPGEAAPQLFLESLFRKGNQNLPSLLVQVLFAYVENTYFSARWWESLPVAPRDHLTALAGIANPYYTDIHYSLSTLVPWEITQVQVLP